MRRCTGRGQEWPTGSFCPLDGGGLCHLPRGGAHPPKHLLLGFLGASSRYVVTSISSPFWWPRPTLHPPRVPSLGQTCPCHPGSPTGSTAGCRGQAPHEVPRNTKGWKGGGPGTRPLCLGVQTPAGSQIPVRAQGRTARWELAFTTGPAVQHWPRGFMESRTGCRREVLHPALSRSQGPNSRVPEMSESIQEPRMRVVLGVERVGVGGHPGAQH